MFFATTRSLRDLGSGLASRTRGALSWRRLTGAAGVLIGTTVTINLLRIANTVVLTRLLSPSDYGLAGIVSSVFFIIAMLTDTGCQAFIVRHARGMDSDFLDAVWTIHLVRGLLTAALAVALALPVAALLAKPAIAPLLAVSALSVAIDGASSLSLITALREKLVRRLSALDLATSLVQMGVVLVAAWFLRSVWAIVLAVVATSATRTLASYFVFPNARQRVRFDRAVAGELWRFSRLIAASSTLTLIMSQIDRLVLARVFSLRQFGIYSVAGGLASAPTALVHLYASRIMYPSFAETWRTAPEQLRRVYYDMRGTVFYGYLVAAGGLIGAAPLLVAILYDPRYAGVSFYLRLLSITTAFYMLTRPMNEVLVAAGRVRATLETNVVRVVWLVAAAAIGYATIGPIGVVIALSVIEIPAYLYSAYRLIGIGVFSLGHELVAFGMIGLGLVLGLLAATLLPLAVAIL